MALSPAHRFGQMIGDVLERTVEPFLAEFAAQHRLYLDKKGVRPARQGAKVSWTDLNGNKHDLDFVVERGGTPHKRGVPVAFIETAWRRYTKHSRNKAQEIQGAIMPLCETHQRHCPFKGAVLAGVFTEGALAQLRSLGFAVAYFPYWSVVKAFQVVGIDAASNESTGDEEFAEKMRKWDALDASSKAKVPRELAQLNLEEIGRFTESLRKVVLRAIKFVRILPLHGQSCQCGNIGEAITFIEHYQEDGEISPFVRYEVEVVYMNDDRISGEFSTKEAAIEFLSSYSSSPSSAPATGA